MDRIAGTNEFYLPDLVGSKINSNIEIKYYFLPFIISLKVNNSL